MGNWMFNTELFSHLSDALDLSQTEIAKRCGMQPQTLNRYIRNSSILPVQALIQICNALRMPAYLFFATERFTAPFREFMTKTPDNFEEIKWDNQAVEDVFGDGSGQITWTEVARVMNVTSQKPHSRFLLQTKLPIPHFVDTCNRFNLSPFIFLLDNNAPGSEVRKPAKRKSDFNTLHDEITSLRQDLARTREELSAALSEIARLRTDHNKLAHNLHININSMSDSNLSIAAEPSTKYKKSK